ncbi:MAG: peptidyl-prolyl cis-trans isomerase B (cyclophilin B) [Motiliproteus sp.]
MTKLLCCLILCLSTPLLAATAPETTTTEAAAPTQVKLETNLGAIIIRLDTDNAPLSAANFISYVNSGFYDDTLFHRVINGFMIQGGGMSTDMTRKETQAPIRNESDNGLNNRTGTIAMARTSAPHSATAQFFINVNNNSSLDYTPGNWGYAVFGEVVEGMALVNKIKHVSTTTKNNHRDVPVEPIVIVKAIVLP